MDILECAASPRCPLPFAALATEDADADCCRPVHP
jgi:hypothetical protein